MTLCGSVLDTAPAKERLGARGRAARRGFKKPSSKQEREKPPPGGIPAGSVQRWPCRGGGVRLLHLLSTFEFEEVGMPLELLRATFGKCGSPCEDEEELLAALGFLQGGSVSH